MIIKRKKHHPVLEHWIGCVTLCSVSEGRQMQVVLQMQTLRKYENTF